MNRNLTRQIKVGNLLLGGQNKVLIQSMCNIKTSKYDEVIKQIKELESIGCDIIRVSVMDEEDAKAIKIIKENINVPLVADIHFDYKLALLSIENGVDKIRINPGNIGSQEKIKQVVDACKNKNIPIRIGVNSGSIDKELPSLNEYKVSAQNLVESAKKHVKILQKFHLTS